VCWCLVCPRASSLKGAHPRIVTLSHLSSHFSFPPFANSSRQSLFPPTNPHPTMPLFQTVMTAKSTTSPATLCTLMKSITSTVLSTGGVVRTVENMGVRQLPTRFKSKFADRNGVRYHSDGRFVAIRFDASPDTMETVSSIIKMEEDVLRHTTTRPVEPEAAANVNKWKRNPFLDIDNKVRNLQHVKDTEEVLNRIVMDSDFPDKPAYTFPRFDKPGRS